MRQSQAQSVESVWDYPRPPRLEPTSSWVAVIFADQVIAETNRALRVLETSHPPVYYIPPADVMTDALAPAEGSSFCEWKGVASYLDLRLAGRTSARAAWRYSSPVGRFGALKDHIAFYPSRVQAAFVDAEQVAAQAGDFYGGWITSWIEGPFKGGPGTRGW